MDSEHEKVWDNVQISEERTAEVLQESAQLPPDQDRAAKLIDLSRQYMESVVSELNLDRQQFYEGVGVGINMILNMAAKLITGKKPPEI